MRIKTKPGDQGAPRIDSAAVESFFSKRAVKAKSIGSLRAVIYQDNHPDLAERRDAAEKALLLPKLGLQDQNRVLDIGCGTGRWSQVIASQVGTYHGTDFSASLIDIARSELRGAINVRYSVLPSVAVSLEALHEPCGFDRIIVLGLFIYLNDEDVFETLRRVAEVAALQCKVLIREPVAIGERLTIKEHFSDDLEEVYNAIYRTEDEILSMVSETLEKSGFELVDHGYVFEQLDMNNRVDTVQKWYMFERCGNN